MPVRRVAVDGWVDPADAFTAVFGSSTPTFWLDGGRDAESGRSWMGAGERVLSATGPAASRGLLDELRDELARPPVADLGGAPLGWVGWFGYELGTLTTGVPLPSAASATITLLRSERVIGFDHGSSTVELVGLDDDPGFDDWVRATLEHLQRSGPSAPRPEPAAVPSSAVRWRHPPHVYETLVRRCQDAITRGDAYQLCLTNTISVDGTFAPLSTYLRLRQASPTHHGGLIVTDGVALLSSSPEQFLRIGPDGHVITKPIKGTRPRGATLARDLELRSELEASDKEQAENLMIVDLMRNDLGRVAELGSVSVSSLLAVESYAQVHQLVSTVEARLPPGVGPIEAIEACFPAGSMTGAPKISAMRILAELEAGPRGIYSGAFGYLALDGSVDLAMVIRSIVLTDAGATIGTGGGITALSVPVDEVEETRIKAAALLAALGASVH